MNYLLAIIIIFFGAGLGAYLNITKKMKSPAYFYTLGFYIGIIVSLIMKGL